MPGKTRGGHTLRRRQWLHLESEHVEEGGRARQAWDIYFLL